MKKYGLLAVSGLLLLGLSGCANLGAPSRIGTGEAPTVVQLAKSTHSWDGALLPRYPEGQPEVTILHITIPGGARLPLHYHPVINAGYLLEGQLTVVCEDGQRLNLKAGDPIIELVSTPHYGINEGDSPAVIVVFYAGEKGAAITTKTP